MEHRRKSLIRCVQVELATRGQRRLLATVAHSGAHVFGGGKGSRAGSGLSLANIALSVRMRGESGVTVAFDYVVKLFSEGGALFVG